jgi:hypothetical protein
MTKNEALRLALEALEKISMGGDPRWADQAITAIKAAVEAKDEPVAYINVEQRKLEWAKYMSWDTPTVVNLPKIPLYTTPQRTWVGLTDEEIAECFEFIVEEDTQAVRFAQAIEAKLKEKNS